MSTRTRRPTAACLIALMFALLLPSAAAADTTSTIGWVRLAHLSPNTPPVDVYLYPYGGRTAQLTLKHVAYGTLSPYESLAPGDYLVAMRAAGDAATADPVISTQVDVAAGRAYTVAGLGTASALTLRVLTDNLDTPAGKVSVRVIEASLHNPTASVGAGGDTLATGLRFPDVSDYQTLAPGASTVHVSTQAGDKTTQLDFAAGSTYTLAVLDGAGDSPRILDLSDATGTSVPPKGGVNTGFGGTAAQPVAASQPTGPTTQPTGPTTQSGHGSVVPAGWGVLLIAVIAAVLFGLSRQRRK
jgi:hypothetical protein